MKNLLLTILSGLILLSPLTAAAACASLTSNIVSYWKMNGNSNDAVSTNNGVDTSITYNSANGIIPQGAGFGGASKIVLTNIGLGGTGDKSWSFWMKTTNAAQQVMFDGRSAGGVNGQFYFDTTLGTKVDFFSSDASGAGTTFNNVTTTGTPSIDDGNWHHVVFTVSGTAGKFYLDGSLNASPTGDLPINISGSFPSAFGWDQRDNAQFYNGNLDEIGVWTCALTSTQVTTLYNGGVGLTYPFVIASVTPTSIVGLIRAFFWGTK